VEPWPQCQRTMALTLMRTRAWAHRSPLLLVARAGRAFVSWSIATPAMTGWAAPRNPARWKPRSWFSALLKRERVLFFNLMICGGREQFVQAWGGINAFLHWGRIVDYRFYLITQLGGSMLSSHRWTFAFSSCDLLPSSFSYIFLFVYLWFTGVVEGVLIGIRVFLLLCSFCVVCWGCLGLCLKSGCWVFFKRGARSPFSSSVVLLWYAFVLAFPSLFLYVLSSMLFYSHCVLFWLLICGASGWLNGSLGSIWGMKWGWRILATRRLYLVLGWDEWRGGKQRCCTNEPPGSPLLW